MPINRYSKHYTTTLEVPVDIEITPKDIEHWIDGCNYDEDLLVLKELQKQIKWRIWSLEHPDDDDFRSRA